MLITACATRLEPINERPSLSRQQAAQKTLLIRDRSRSSFRCLLASAAEPCWRGQSENSVAHSTSLSETTGRPHDIKQQRRNQTAALLLTTMQCLQGPLLQQRSQAAGRGAVLPKRWGASATKQQARSASRRGAVQVRAAKVAARRERRQPPDFAQRAAHALLLAPTGRRAQQLLFFPPSRAQHTQHHTIQCQAADSTRVPVRFAVRQEVRKRGVACDGSYARRRP